MQAGLDSLAAVELRNVVRGRYGIDAAATIAFDHPTIEALAAHIGTLLAARAVMAIEGARADTALMSAERRMTSAPTAVDVIAAAAKYPGAERSGEPGSCKSSGMSFGDI